MNRTILNAIAIILLLLIPVVLLSLIYNGLVNREEAVFESWAQVESQYQRRADLIPAIIDAVGAYTRHERDTLTEVTEQRSAAVSAAIDQVVGVQRPLAELMREGERLLEDQELLDRFNELQAELGRDLSRFVALAEDYPELRASDQFLELQAQLEGTENRINVARLRFNEAVKDYNAAIRRLPGTLVAGIGNFHRKAYFRSDQGAGAAPEVDLG